MNPDSSVCRSPSYLGLLPAGEVDVVAEEVGHVLLRHLTLQRLQQVCEPLEGLRLRAEPVEVDLGKKKMTQMTLANVQRSFRGRSGVRGDRTECRWAPHLLGEDVLVVLDAFVPHRLEDGGEGSHSDAGAHQHHHLVAKHVFTGRTKRAVDGDPETQKGETFSDLMVVRVKPKEQTSAAAAAPQRGEHRCRISTVSFCLDSRSSQRLEPQTCSTIKHRGRCLVQRLGPVPDDADVGAEVVLLGGGGQGEGVPLQPGDGRTLDEDVLTHLHAEAFPLHLQLQSLVGVHHHLETR
ncbi:hypothetical protein INR49_022019 [Caranx melampygus]|nr:hypothetical protein INR49_022019 [Caranx melampygus]